MLCYLKSSLGWIYALLPKEFTRMAFCFVTESLKHDGFTFYLQKFSADSLYALLPKVVTRMALCLVA